jgi:hypothetical protein
MNRQKTSSMHCLGCFRKNAASRLHISGPVFQAGGECLTCWNRSSDTRW